MSPFQGQRCNCHVIWLKTAQRLFLILNTLPFRALLFALCSFIMCASSAANNSSIRVIRCYAVQGPNLRPILRRKKRVIRPFKVRIGSLYQVIDLRPRVALPSAANRAAFGREQHYSWPQIDNVSVTRLTFNRASALCRPASPPLSSQKKAPTRIIFDPGGSVLSLYSPSHHDCLESEIVTYVLSSFVPWRVSFVV